LWLQSIEVDAAGMEMAPGPCEQPVTVNVAINTDSAINAGGANEAEILFSIMTSYYFFAADAEAFSILARESIT
ncbi:MAG TPA: hypothetical protein VFM46_08990, partial [Pseudomonadales bacterium]|nr:hypothetical protein [Pseudomonadales bacterium]